MKAQKFYKFFQFILVIISILMSIQISVSSNLQAQERVLNLQLTPEYGAALNTTEFDFHLTQRKAETWQPYVENLYKNARLLKNGAYILTTANFVLYISMHRRISFGHYQTDNIDESLNTLNAICGAVAIGSLIIYIIGNTMQSRANQIINQESFSLKVGSDGVGIVYKL